MTTPGAATLAVDVTRASRTDAALAATTGTASVTPVATGTGVTAGAQPQLAYTGATSPVLPLGSALLLLLAGLGTLVLRKRH